MMFTQQSNWSVMWIIVWLRGYTNCMQHYCLPHTCMHIYCVCGSYTVYKTWWSMSQAFATSSLWSLEVYKCVGVRPEIWSRAWCPGRHTRCPNSCFTLTHPQHPKQWESALQMFKPLAPGWTSHMGPALCSSSIWLVLFTESKRFTAKPAARGSKCRDVGMLQLMAGIDGSNVSSCRSGTSKLWLICISNNPSCIDD